jgi:hypothetical protein
MEKRNMMVDVYLGVNECNRLRSGQKISLRFCWRRLIMEILIKSFYPTEFLKGSVAAVL